MINKILSAIIDWVDLLIMKITYRINRLNAKGGIVKNHRLYIHLESFINLSNIEKWWRGLNWEEKSCLFKKYNLDYTTQKAMFDFKYSGYNGCSQVIKNEINKIYFKEIK